VGHIDCDKSELLSVNTLHVCLTVAKTRCYILGSTQGAFFIFHLLTKPFPSRDQPPIHLNHMTNHLTKSPDHPHDQSHATSVTCFSKSPVLYHLLLKVTCPISPAPKSPAHHLILPHLTSHDPISAPDSSLLLTSVSFLDSWPAHYTFLIASFYDSY